MEKIYSRKRIKLYKIDKKLVKFIIIIIIAITTVIAISKSINPIFENLCKEKAINIGTEISNKKANEALEMYDLSNILSFIKTGNDETGILKIDVVTINKVASEIALKAEEEFQKVSDEVLSIPIGALTGNKYLAGIGPEFKIKINLAGNIETQLKTEFVKMGINQTMYRIYLDIFCTVNVVTAYKTIPEKINNQVLLVESVIVGDVPETYYNLNGIAEDDLLDVLE